VGGGLGRGGGGEESCPANEGGFTGIKAVCVLIKFQLLLIMWYYRVCEVIKLQSSSLRVGMAD